MEEMEQGISQLIHAESERPMLLEVFTDMDVETRCWKLSRSADRGPVRNLPDSSFKRIR
jgi:hypothetical protein